MNLRLHAVEPRSTANGPGRRFVVWFQGCTLDCPGCFNPGTHDPNGGFSEPVQDLLKKVSGNWGQTPIGVRPQFPDTFFVEGVTVTGGEPFEQPGGLLELVRGIRETTSLSVLVFSGLTHEEIRRLPLGPAILEHVDVLVAGRYVASLHLGEGLRGSANQRLHLLTDRYTESEIESTAPTEILIGPDGTLRFTGIDPPAL